MQSQMCPSLCSYIGWGTIDSKTAGNSDMVKMVGLPERNLTFIRQSGARRIDYKMIGLLAVVAT
jgi:hypothetical protein